MEYLWCILAAAVAGMSIGFVGISSAIVMVPVLIVLCPAFGGEFGAFQATSIALASDIFAYAVTMIVYARNGNVDIKHGSVLFASIIVMSIIGSIAAYRVGNVVLSSFTMILTFTLGVRFLFRPDPSERRRGRLPEVRLGCRSIFISVFFGLIIGFSIGFMGSVIGRMIIVILIVLLGYNFRSAVGTNAFIMMFTALVAFASHAVIYPEVVFSRWDLLIICIVVTTVAALISARFGNRAPAKTVGRITGGVLTVLGLAMISIYIGGMVVEALGEILMGFYYFV